MCKEYVMYESFDELPDELKEKFKNGARGWNLSRAKDGYVGFVNLLCQQGDELIGDYVGDKVKTQVRFGECGHIVDASPNRYKKGEGCGVCRGLQIQQGINDLATLHPHLIKEWHPTKNGELTPHDVTQSSGKKVWWQCEKGHEWEATIVKRTDGRGCPYCSNRKVLKGYNDLATTHPHYVKYFANIENAYTHTYSSSKKVELRCPDCGHTKVMQVSRLTHYGFSCDLCSDGISFSEKLMGSILTKLNIEFIKQMSYDNGEHRYDFYLPKYNAILETHGLQHYEHGFKKFGKTLEEEQENDRYKRELAISNGVLNENYNEIDCRYSTLEYCRPNIEKTLSNYINTSLLTDEDWKEANIQAQKSLKIEVCKYWEENKRVNSELTVAQVSDVFGKHNTTVSKYLKWGSVFGFCVYDAQGEVKANNRRKTTFAYLIKGNGDKWFNEAMGIAELSRQTGITIATVKNNLDKGALKYYPYSKYDPKYIGSYIVSADVYDSQNSSKLNT